MEDDRDDDQEEIDETAPLRITPSRCHGAPQQPEPEDKTDREQYLPKAADLEEFPTLVAEPEPGAAQPLKEPRPFAKQAPDNHHAESREKQVNRAALPGRLPAAEQSRDKQGTADISGGDPQDRELQMPSAQQVARQESCQIDAIETAGIGSVMRDATADQRLAEEQKSGDRHEFQGRALCVAYRQNRGACGHRFAAVPAEIIELSEGEKHGRGPAE